MSSRNAAWNRNVAERERFGMDCSPEAIEAARLHPKRVVRRGSGWWTPTEWETVTEKARAFQEPPKADVLRGPAAETFAGVEHDLQLPLGGWHVGFTRAPDVFVEELRSAYPYPDRLVPFLARLSLVDLVALEKQVMSAHDEFRARGLELHAAEINVRKNWVDVYVEAFEAHDRAWLTRRFDGVHLIDGVIPGFG